MADMQEEQLSFFPSADGTARPEGDKPRPPKPDKAAPRAQDKEPAVYDKDRMVAYAGHQLPITDRTLSLEQIRQLLEPQYPELSKDRCDMTYDNKTGIIVPVVKGARKGGGGQCDR